MNKERLKKYFYENVASIFWSALLLIGGAIFIIYYALIGYMPDFDLKSSVTITAAASVTSIIITSIMLVMMVYAGSFWGGIWNALGEKSKLKNYWIENSDIINLRNLLIWFSIPLFSVYISIGVFLYTDEWKWMIVLVVVLFAFLTYLCFFSGFGFKRGFIEFLFLVIATLFSAVFIFYPLYLVFKLSIEEFSDVSHVSLFYGSLAALFIVFINVVSASPQGNSTPYAKELVLGSMALVMVFLMFGKFDRIPYSVMKIYKFGNLKVSELVLNKDGCELYESLGLEASSTDYNMCIARDVLILSRLGKEAYLEVKEDDGGELRFTIPASFIVSWTINKRNTDG